MRHRFQRNARQRMDKSLMGYLEAALFTATDDDGEPLDRRGYTIYDFAPEAVNTAKGDIAFYREAAGDFLDEAMVETGNGEEEFGRDLWFTANGHGVGFWDGDWYGFGEELTRIARRIRERNVVVGDDGSLYLE